MAKIEVLVVRDPDGGTNVMMFVDGEECNDYTEYVVDAGAGHLRAEWDAETDEIAVDEALSPAFREHVVAERQDPPGRNYITDF